MPHDVKLLYIAVCTSTVFLGACSSLPNGAGPLDAAYQWVPGVYQVRGEIRYRVDTGAREDTERVRLLADVTVGQGGPTSLYTDAGVCLEPEVSQSNQARRRKGWDVRCGEAEFTLWPHNDRVGGRVSMLVTEMIRVGSCVQYSTDANGNRVCTRYEYNLRVSRVKRSSNVRTTLVR